jgi:hypothetical protein
MHRHHIPPTTTIDVRCDAQEAAAHVLAWSQPTQRERNANANHKAGDLGEAERLAQGLLAEPWIEQESAMKLRALLDRIADDRAAGGAGVVRQRLRMLGVSRIRPPRRPLFRGARP